MNNLLKKEDFYLIALGSSLISGVVIILFGKNISKKQYKRAYLYFGISILLISIYLFDYQFRLTSGNVVMFLTLKKIFLLSSYFSLFLYLMGIEQYVLGFFKSKWLNFAIFPIAFLIATSPNFSYYVRFSQIGNLFVLFLIIYTLIVIFAYKVERLYFSFTFLALCVAETIFGLLFDTFTEYDFLLGYGLITVFLGLSIKLTLDYKNIILENQYFYEKSLTDPLTGAYNREIFNSLNPAGYFVLIDLDKFKEYNDKFGHKKGDELLKGFVSFIKGRIRQEDLIIRIGGDEFVIITNAHEPEKFIERLRRDVYKELGIGFSYGMSIFNNFSKAYKVADKKLYNMKKNKSKL
ncbi:GGDEF domain-containing protein [Thermosipho ferrireducens]|uniref:GGDEF domain-containing protein n=1 Tax=Thermosipho ferrireducens TaxID=2571116 RepID=A0ABX7S480_9BACT|nr:GGDEF domain-containing protein [Thermosipho ferrireducens]QTA37226.1 GGDEF domain-containing protein [Thermosipho ferrireducens]